MNPALRPCVSLSANGAATAEETRNCRDRRPRLSENDHSPRPARLPMRSPTRGRCGNRDASRPPGERLLMRSPHPRTVRLPRNGRKIVGRWLAAAVVKRSPYHAAGDEPPPYDRAFHCLRTVRLPRRKREIVGTGVLDCPRTIIHRDRHGYRGTYERRAFSGQGRLRATAIAGSTSLRGQGPRSGRRPG